MVSGAPPGALSGLRVLDLTSGVAGPVAGMLLGDLDADVVKVEQPGAGPSTERPWLHMWDRNKTAVVLDPERPDADVLRGLHHGVRPARLRGIGAAGILSKPRIASEPGRLRLPKNSRQTPA